MSNLRKAAEAVCDLVDTMIANGEVQVVSQQPYRSVTLPVDRWRELADDCVGLRTVLAEEDEVLRERKGCITAVQILTTCKPGPAIDAIRAEYPDLDSILKPVLDDEGEKLARMVLDGAQFGSHSNTEMWDHARKILEEE